MLDTHLEKRALAWLVGGGWLVGSPVAGSGGGKWKRWRRWRW